MIRRSAPRTGTSGGLSRRLAGIRGVLASGVIASGVIATGLITVVVVLEGCDKRQGGTTVRPGARLQFEMGDRHVDVKVVFEAKTRELGLMFVEPDQLGEDEGMLFVYPTLEFLGFWMKNTVTPLSIAYIGDDGTILQIEDMQPADERSVKSRHRIRYALEMHQGWFERAGFGEGRTIPGFERKLRPFRDIAEPSPRRSR